jgi:hypothetical protein
LHVGTPFGNQAASLKEALGFATPPRSEFALSQHRSASACENHGTNLGVLQPIGHMAIFLDVRRLGCKSRNWSPLPLFFHPTAQMRLGATAATPSNELLRVPGLGLETIVHEVSFHRCIRLLWEVAVREEPTAHALVLLRTATPVSTLSPLVPAFGLVTTRHWVPFQRSMSVL